MKKTNIGGQAVLEGVMMRSEHTTGIAVRKETGEIVTQKKPTKPLSAKYKIVKLPIIRGVVNFFEMLILGVKTITDAAKLYDPEMAEEEKPSKAEEFIAKKTGKDSMDVAIFFAVIMAVALAVGLFFILPNLITGWITPYVDQPILKNLIDGLVRITIFISYMAIISNMKDIKRLFAYHGAEHKVIHCYEHEMPLDVEHAKKCSRLHPRCGTSFLLIVMTISILLFSLLGWSDNAFVRIALRLAMLPVVAGVSYEMLKLLAKKDNCVTNFLRKPGMLLQKLSTREPDEEMLETAILSFRVAEGVLSDEEIAELTQKFSKKVVEEKEEQEVQEETVENSMAEAMAKGS